MSDELPRLVRLPRIDEMHKRRPTWSPGRLFVGGDGRAWAMPVIDDTIIRSCPDLLHMLYATNLDTMASGKWVGEHTLANKVAADLIQIQYDLDTDELLRVLSAEPLGIAGSSPEAIAMMLSMGDGLKAGRISLSTADDNNRRKR